MMEFAGLIILAQLSVSTPQPPPPDPLLSAGDIATVRSAIDKLKEQGLNADYSVVERLSSAVGPTQLPMVGFALSRSSNDPKACALLKRIEPSAVCMK